MSRPFLLSSGGWKRPGQAPDQDAFCQSEGHQQTIVNAVVAYIGEGAQRTLWKLLIGRIPLAGWTFPKYPGSPPANGSRPETPTISCGTPGVNGTGCLYNLSQVSARALRTTHYLRVRPAECLYVTDGRGGAVGIPCRIRTREAIWQAGRRMQPSRRSCLR
jgi:hypothetical protein